jgi:Phage tail sheath protein subtilisin-like domain/Phage tail sheath C-terminal domain
MAVTLAGQGGGFQLSAGVNFSEIDQTTSVPNVSTSTGAVAGVFRWGPIETPTLIASENDLVKNFGGPTNLNPETWFSAANFLAYGNALWVSRAANTWSSASAYANVGPILGAISFNPSTQVGASNDAILALGLVPGDKVTYTVAGGNTAVSGLTNSASYWVVGTGYVNSTATGVQLSSTYDGAKIDIAAGTNETGHIFNITQRASQNIKNVDDYNAKAGSFSANVQYVAKYPGVVGNSLKVSVVDNANQYSSTFDFSNTTTTNSSFSAAASIYSGNAAISVGSNTITLTFSNTAGSTPGFPLAFANSVANAFIVGDIITIGNTSIGKQTVKITALANVQLGTSTGFVPVSSPTGIANGLIQMTLSVDQPNKLSTNFTSNTITRSWEYSTVVGTAPGKSDYQNQFGNTSANDLMHVVVVDAGGAVSGNPGTVLEVFQNVSRATDSKLTNGVSNYYKNVIANQSAYVWFASDRSTAPSATAALLSSSSGINPLTLSFSGGVDTGDESSEAFASIARAYDPLANKDRYNIAFVISGKSRGDINNAQLPNYLIDNIAEVRKDCVVFVSPNYSAVVNNVTGQIASDVVSFRNNVRASSYAVMDSGYKYQYDKYNDTNRWVPLNGDIAGLCAYTDLNYDPWWSPAGTTRGSIKNVIKLAYNPSKSDRDYLYQNYVNPVVVQQGQGTVLLGDKTLIGKSSAFDRINVRRLFITLEKAISKAAQNSLFEFNDAFTQAQFVNYVTPYLRTVQGRRGIQNFQVICDSTNNTPAVVDANQFVGDIYIQPNRSINYIQLNFVAVSSGVTFSTVTGS